MTGPGPIKPVEKEGDGLSRVLVVDDSSSVRDLLTAVLTQENGYEVVEASNGKEALAQLEQQPFQLVISDIRMPEMDGISLLAAIRARFGTLPVIMVTGFGNEIGPRTLELGADDCIYLPFRVEEFKFRVARVLSFHRLIETREALLRENQELWYRVITDTLTGIYNRHYFDDVFTAEFERARRYKSHLGLIIFDIDFFKNVNDVYGHLVGDQVLQQIGELTVDAIRRVDIAARYGGEEFVLILPETVPDGIELVAERLRVMIENHDFVVNTSEGEQTLPRITISIGAAYYPDERYPDANAFLTAADDKLYEAKRNGRNRVEIAWH